VTFECRYESDAFSACTSPKAYPTSGGNALYDGSHTYGVRARDAAGNYSTITTITVVGQ
jgi:hypothetical protein